MFCCDVFLCGVTFVVHFDVDFADIENRADSTQRADFTSEQIDNAKPLGGGKIGPRDDGAVNCYGRTDISEQRWKDTREEHVDGMLKQIRVAMMDPRVCNEMSNRQAKRIRYNERDVERQKDKCQFGEKL